ncbi:MAG: undecaprenyl-diphosphate phosphatase, partial [Pseudomonadota bacterium]
LADMLGKEVKNFEDMTWRDGLIVGIAQALAIIPGTSRSGVTMTAARALGCSALRVSSRDELAAALTDAASRAAPTLLELPEDAFVSGPVGTWYE